jgi:hypothetical protein
LIVRQQAGRDAALIRHIRAAQAGKNKTADDLYKELVKQSQ